MFVSKSERNVSDRWPNEKMSFEMGLITFAASVYVSKEFPDIWHIFVCKGTGCELQSMSR